MSFCDLRFIVLLLPLFAAVYRFIPQRFRTPLMLGASLALYFCQASALTLPGLLVMPTVGLLTFGACAAIKRFEKYRKPIFIATVAVLAAVLGCFKYIAGGESMPAGISFYIFTAISCAADFFRKPDRELSPLKFGAYFTMYPKLMSGPLARYDDVTAQLDGHAPALYDIAEGTRLFITGLAAKTLLADMLGRTWKQICAVGFESISTPLAWLGAFAFSMQLYFDFHGYSLMACGMARMLGIGLPRNFDYPYMSRSMTEFWRRWHITLGQWFRDYIYIPLGGSRNGRRKMLLSLLVVWLLTGIWHGATLNFAVWGLLLFAIIAAEKLWLGKHLDAHPRLARIYLLVLVPLSWMVFANTGFGDMLTYISRMLIPAGDPTDVLRFVRTSALSFCAGALCCTPLPRKWLEPWREKIPGTVVYALLLAASIYVICRMGNDPFMYFSF